MDQRIPEEVTAHLSSMVESSKDPWAKESAALERLQDLWLEKNRLFTEQIELLKMEFVNEAAADDDRGMILTTYSGSLVALGPGDKRRFNYASIKIRSDVPDILNSDDVSLVGGVSVGSAASFADAPVKHTSAIYRIAVTPADLSAEEQLSRVREAMAFLTTSFVQINRNLTSPGESGPGQFDKKSIIRYLADSNGISQTAIRGILDEYHVLLESGMLMGKTVSLGQLGRLSLNTKPIRKARVGRNPATGEEITIPAKPAHMAPSFKFSSRAKERAQNLPMPEDE